MVIRQQNHQPDQNQQRVTRKRARLQKSDWKTKELVTSDKNFAWRPFTNMRNWCAPEHEPLVLVEGQGAISAAVEAIQGAIVDVTSRRHRLRHLIICFAAK